MLDPFPGFEAPQSHRFDLLKEAEDERPVHAATADALRLPDRLILATGDALIGAGLRPYAWYQVGASAAPPRPWRTPHNHRARLASAGCRTTATAGNVRGRVPACRSPARQACVH